MEKQTLFNYQGQWTDIFDFLDVNDYFSLELSNKNIRNQLLTYYKMKTKNMEPAQNQKSLKKLFLTKYMNSFVVFNVMQEFNSLEENILKSNNEEVHSKKKKEKEVSVFIDNARTCVSSQKNCLFSQDNIIQQIVLNESRIFVLYYNRDLKIFSADLHGNYTFEMKFNFANIKIKKFIFVKEKSTFIIIDSEGRIYSFYYPCLQELVKLNNDEIYMNLSLIGDLGIFISDLFSIKDFILLLDDKDNFYFIHVDNLGLNNNNNKEELVTSNQPEEGNVDINKELKIKILSIERNYSKILKISSAESNVMFVDDSYKVCYINSAGLDSMTTTTFTAKVISEFQCKLVQEIACGDNHWLVLEREEIKPLEKWNESDVQQWFHSMDMDEFLNIIKYEKINGKDIANADETFFVNLMGMMDDQIKKVKYEINNVKNVSCKKTRLLGWGSNKHGQLGQINYNNTFIKKPTVVNLPDMKHENDFIIKVFCGKTYTLLQTKFGELFITGNYSPKEKISQNPHQNFNTSNYSGGQKNKIVEKNKSHTVNINTCNRWVNITKEVCFDTISDENYYFRAKEIFAKENKIFFFGYKSSEIPFTLQAKKPKLKHLKKGDKFPTSDAIVEKILAKNKNLIDKFIIVYEDALLKFLETPLEDFLESEVPYHKIYQIKFFNNIIWDRKKRYYKMDYN